MAYNEDDLLPISALQHLLFCERQCALIHVERQWEENRLTAEGRHLHNRAHDGNLETRGRLRTVRGLWLSSLQWGITGQSDVVEFLAPDGQSVTQTLAGQLSAGAGIDWTGWIVRPVEYKRGKPKKDDSDRVQVCAQALCLEEMLGIPVSEGALFYGQRKRRTVVSIDDPLRAVTARSIHRLRTMIQSNETPPAIREPKCDSCSLIEICMPQTASRLRSASLFVDAAFTAHVRDSAN